MPGGPNNRLSHYLSYELICNCPFKRNQRRLSRTRGFWDNSADSQHKSLERGEHWEPICFFLDRRAAPVPDAEGHRPEQPSQEPPVLRASFLRWGLSVENNRCWQEVARLCDWKNSQFVLTRSNTGRIRVLANPSPLENPPISPEWCLFLLTWAGGPSGEPLELRCSL